jgi:hypothetical protein
MPEVSSASASSSQMPSLLAPTLLVSSNSSASTYCPPQTLAEAIDDLALSDQGGVPVPRI